ncbi:MAG: CoB--CoM heterodisulfide reductase iron-sulfur subunit A family protein [Desulfobacteraceae bacterium]|nr:CoB--CoM heterodisulfide reductase iron-sulfur subunit A family protein [Desulfobacteraceae bacterium]
MEENKPRIGVFICDCGSNIAGHLDCAEVTEYAATLPNVVFAKENLYTCSEAGIEEIKKGIKDHNLTRVVVASCSPRTHQPLFSSSCGEAGLNPYLFEMANIRDQCSWVHMGAREVATDKAKDLVRMSVAKSASLEPQEEIESSIVNKVLVIGGGVAGLSAAEALAKMGLEVILVEKQKNLGGLLRIINKLETKESAIENISAQIKTISSLANIQTFTEAKVEGIEGYIGNYEVTIQSQGKTFEHKVGCIVAATGALPFIPEKGSLGYNSKNVITQMELEQRLKEGNLDAKNIVMIQCAGSRIKEREYCSRLCCMTAVKNALLIKESNPDTEISILYRDMQMYGTTKEQMLWDARGEGINFHIYDETQPPQVNKADISFYQAIIGETKEIEYDLAVLATPLIASKGSKEIAQMLRVPTDKNGFFLEAHAKLRPLDFAADGIFLCGSARFPATSEEARTQGIGVASRIGAILFKDNLVKSAIVAEIDPATCAGCLACVGVCPYEAISFNKEHRVCEINEVLCKGCGNCASTCPSDSATLKGYKPEQLLSQIGAA